MDVLSKPHGHSATHLRDLFEEDTPDHEWIDQLAEDGDWVILTHDRLAKNPLEKEALRASGLKVFIMKAGWSNQKGWEKAWKLVRWWPRIIEQAEGLAGGAAFSFGVKFSGKGKFEQLRL